MSHGYKSTYKLQVGGATTEDYYSTRDATTTGTLSDHVKGHVTQKYDSGREQTVAGGDNTCHWTTSATFDTPSLTENYGKVARTVTGTHTEIVAGAESRIVGGAVSWTHASPTTIMSAAPWVHVGGAPITMVAPKITMAQPDHTSFWGKSLSTGWLALKLYGASVALQGAKVDITPSLAFTVAGIKIDHPHSAYFQNKGFNLATEAAKVSPGGPTINIRVIAIFI